MPTEAENKAWADAGNQGTLIEGGHLKCNGKDGTWSIDDEEIDPSNMRLAVIMPSATWGKIRYEDRKIAEKDIGKISDGFLFPQIPKGWNPYTALLCVRADEGHLGELVTFTSSSFGGKNAFQRLVNPYRLKNMTQFPVVALGTKERGDDYGTIDPVFNIVGWEARRVFAELLRPEEAPQIGAPETLPRVAAPRGIAASYDPPAPPTADDGHAGIDPDDVIYD